MVGGLTTVAWSVLYFACTRKTRYGPQRWAWPDGRSYMEQPAIACAMFDAFDWALLAEIEGQSRGK